MLTKITSAIVLSALFAIPSLAQTPLSPEADLLTLREAGVSSANFCADLERWEKTLGFTEEDAPLLQSIKGYQAACSLPAEDLSQADASAALGEEPLSVTLTGDMLTLFARSPENAPYLCCSIRSVAWKQLNQSGLWAGRLRIAQPDKALLQFSIFDPKASGLSDSILIHGANAPAKSLFMADPDLAHKGQLIETTLTSPELGETRKITIYLPAGHKADGSTSTLIMADGTATAYYARMVEPMIDAGLIKPLAIIGVHSGQGAIVNMDDALTEYDVRSLDYLPQWDEEYAIDLTKTHPNRFENHMSFVTDTLLPWARDEYGLSTKREDTGVTGQSSGGVFALYAGLLHPEVFAVSLPVSPGWRALALRQALPISGDTSAFFIAAGLYEPSFLRSAQASAESLNTAGYAVTTTWNAAGHSPDQTEAMLFKYLPLAYPPHAQN